MARGVARGVENVEGAVGEEVDGVEGPELQVFAFLLKVEFVDFTALDVGFEEGRVWIGGEAGHELGGETGTDCEGCGGGEGREIS